MLNNAPAALPRQEFWDGLADGRFLLPACGGCRLSHAPGTSVCPRCGGTLRWAPAADTGVVYSLMERHAPAAPVAPSGPLAPSDALTTVVAVISLDAGPRMMGLIEAAPRGVAVGDQVHATMAGPREGLPSFALGRGSE